LESQQKTTKKLTNIIAKDLKVEPDLKPKSIERFGSGSITDSKGSALGTGSGPPPQKVRFQFHNRTGENTGYSQFIMGGRLSREPWWRGGVFPKLGSYAFFQSKIEFSIGF
jgi:hypothetical protein